MSAFNASIWAMRFDGVPPQPSVELLHADTLWDDIEDARSWISTYCVGLSCWPSHAVFIVGRDCNTLALTWHEAISGITERTELAALKRERTELREALAGTIVPMERLMSYSEGVLKETLETRLNTARAILERTEPATCQHPTADGLCGAPATHRGMTSGDALCAQCAARREEWDTERTKTT